MEKSNKILFIGSLSQDPKESGVAHSNAGQQIQSEILSALATIASVDSALMMPLPAYPSGSRIVQKSTRNGNWHWLPFINLPIIKHATFSIFLLFTLIQSKPNQIISYNSYFFQNIAIAIYRHLIAKNSRWCTLIQDILPVGVGTRSIQRWLDRKSVNLLRYSDLLAPVTRKIAIDFGLEKNIIILPGGITSVMRKTVYEAGLNEEQKIDDGKIKNFMFAGRLESYNGVDRLVDEWSSRNINAILHVYGDGPLRERMAAAAKRCQSIIYHGPVAHSEITKSYMKMDGIIVLRYSSGIEAEYFFPSKFFEAIISPCAVITNRFSGLESELTLGCEIVDDDLGNLKEIIEFATKFKSTKKIHERRELAIRKYSYEKQIHAISKLLSEI